MASKQRENFGPNTRLAHGGNVPREFHGFVNPPLVRASTVLFPDSATMAARAQKCTYGTRGTSTTEALTAATIPLLASLSAGDRFGLRADQDLGRHGAETAGRRGRILR